VDAFYLVLDFVFHEEGSYFTQATLKPSAKRTSALVRG
jgi:hypothetical protein